jgi:NADPH:quinone reductase-like Zn-dependent oxidoreductase
VIVPALPSTRTRALGELVQRVRGGRLRANIGTVASLDDAVAALNPTERVKGKTIIRVRP